MIQKINHLLLNNNYFGLYNKKIPAMHNTLKGNRFLKNSLMGLAVIGSSMLAGCSHNKVEDIKPDKTEITTEITDIGKFFENMGVCFDNKQFDDVNTISLNAPDSTKMYMDKLNYWRECAFFVCKDVTPDKKSVDYIMSFNRNKDGFSVTRSIPNVERKKFKFVVDNNYFQVFKYDENKDEIHIGKLYSIPDKHKIIYEGNDGTSKMWEVTANNEYVDTNRKILVSMSSTMFGSYDN